MALVPFASWERSLSATSRRRSAGSWPCGRSQTLTCLQIVKPTERLIFEECDEEEEREVDGEEGRRGPCPAREQGRQAVDCSHCRLNGSRGELGLTTTMKFNGLRASTSSSGTTGVGWAASKGATLDGLYVRSCGLGRNQAASVTRETVTQTAFSTVRTVAKRRSLRPVLAGTCKVSQRDSLITNVSG